MTYTVVTQLPTMRINHIKRLYDINTFSVYANSQSVKVIIKQLFDLKQIGEIDYILATAGLQMLEVEMTFEPEQLNKAQVKKSEELKIGLQPSQYSFLARQVKGTIKKIKDCSLNGLFPNQVEIILVAGLEVLSNKIENHIRIKEHPISSCALT